MPFYLPTANAGGDAPNVEDGLALLRFDDLVRKEHPDWAGTDKFGKPDDGTRYHFQFTMMANAEEVAYDEGDPIELDATTRTATGEKSNFRAILAGILTPAELALWEAATPEAPADIDIQGRLVHVKVAHNKKGWPFIESVVGIYKAPKAGK